MPICGQREGTGSPGCSPQGREQSTGPGGRHPGERAWSPALGGTRGSGFISPSARSTRNAPQWLPTLPNCRSHVIGSSDETSRSPASSLGMRGNVTDYTEWGRHRASGHAQDCCLLGKPWHSHTGKHIMAHVMGPWLRQLSGSAPALSRASSFIP